MMCLLIFVVLEDHSANHDFFFHSVFLHMALKYQVNSFLNNHLVYSLPSQEFMQNPINKGYPTMHYT